MTIQDQSLAKNHDSDRVSVSLHYMESVLGITSVIVPDAVSVSLASEDSIGGAAASFDCIFQGNSPLYFVSLVTQASESLTLPENQQLLVKMAGAMGISAEQINLLEGPADISEERWLRGLETLGPCLGVVFVSDEARVPQLFGQFGVRERVAGNPWLATMHPARLVREPQHKRMVWQHLQMMMRELEQKRELEQ